MQTNGCHKVTFKRSCREDSQQTFKIPTTSMLHLTLTGELTKAVWNSRPSWWTWFLPKGLKSSSFFCPLFANMYLNTKGQLVKQIHLLPERFQLDLKVFRMQWNDYSMVSCTFPETFHTDGLTLIIGRLLSSKIMSCCISKEVYMKNLFYFVNIFIETDSNPGMRSWYIWISDYP